MLESLEDRGDDAPSDTSVLIDTRSSECLLRSVLWCEQCGRRMWGKTNTSGRIYCLCQKDPRRHSNRSWFAEHPTAVRLPGDEIEHGVHEFPAAHANELSTLWEPTGEESRIAAKADGRTSDNIDQLRVRQDP